MEPYHLQRNWVKLICWHALVLGFQLLEFCCFLLVQIKTILSRRARNIKLTKLPRHLAIVVDSEDAIVYQSKIVQMLRRLAQLGFQHISLYDMQGVLKSSIFVLAEAVGDDSTLHFYCHEMVLPPRPCAGLPNKSVRCGPMNKSNKSCLICKTDGTFQNAEDMFPLDPKGHMMVEILSLQDGKETIVQAARHICLRALQSNALPNLKEEDIDLSLREIGGAGPDPEVLLLFSNVRCLVGYPAWRLRLTEIMYMRSIRNMTDHCIITALNEFSKKRHRYGK